MWDITTDEPRLQPYIVHCWGISPQNYHAASRLRPDFVVDGFLEVMWTESITSFDVKLWLPFSGRCLYPIVSSQVCRVGEKRCTQVGNMR